MLTGLSSISTSMLDLDAAADLVVGAVELVVVQADALEPAPVAAWQRSARWLVMWMKWPAACQALTVSTAPG